MRLKDWICLVAGAVQGIGAAGPLTRPEEIATVRAFVGSDIHGAVIAVSIGMTV